MMRQQSMQIRAKILRNYETRINHLLRRLSRVQGITLEAKELQEQISLLHERRKNLENHFKEIDDLRDEAAELRDTAREIRATLSARGEVKACPVSPEI
jgi:ribosomal protein S15P/S13E